MRHVQVLITDAKGIALDYQGVGKDAQSLSKDFYLWGQDQEEDVKDSELAPSISLSEASA